MNNSVAKAGRNLKCNNGCLAVADGKPGSVYTGLDIQIRNAWPNLKNIRYYISQNGKGHYSGPFDLCWLWYEVLDWCSSQQTTTQPS